MYSHETFMNFVFPPHLVTVIKARVRIQAARLPLYKEDHMKTGWLLIITRKTGLIIIKKKYSSNLNLLHPTSHYHLISSAGGTEVARGTNGPSNFGRYRSLNVSIKWSSITFGSPQIIGPSDGPDGKAHSSFYHLMARADGTMGTRGTNSPSKILAAVEA